MLGKCTYLHKHVLTSNLFYLYLYIYFTMGNLGPKLKSPLGQFGTQAKIPVGKVPVGQFGTQAKVPFGQFGTQAKFPFGQFGTQAKVPFGQFGTQAKAKVPLFLSVRVVFIFTFLRGIQEFPTINYYIH